MKDQIKKNLNKYVDFSDAEIDELVSKMVFKTYERKEFIVSEGQVCKHKFFILDGLVRSFYFDEKGKEKIIQFALENWWISNMESFVLGIPSTSTIQAIEKTTLLSISKTDLEQLYDKIPKLERFFRMLTENMLIAIQRRNDIYLQMKSKDRYNDLTRNFPVFAQRVPQYMIASYLEITPEYLSELRKNQSDYIS